MTQHLKCDCAVATVYFTLKCCSVDHVAEITHNSADFYCNHLNIQQQLINANTEAFEVWLDFIITAAVTARKISCILPMSGGLCWPINVLYAMNSRGFEIHAH